MNSRQEKMLECIQQNDGCYLIGELEDMFYSDIEESKEFQWTLWFDERKNQVGWITDRREFFLDFLELGNGGKILLKGPAHMIIVWTSCKFLNLPIIKNPNLTYKKRHWAPCLVMDGSKHKI